MTYNHVGFQAKFRVVWPNGAIRHINARARVHRAAAGQPTKLIGTNYDITERKQAAENEGATEPLMRGHETILLVEDELSFLKLTARVLEKQGYTVLAASTPGEAIRLAREHGGEIHLLMTDVVMPEMNGRDLARNLLSLYPHIKRLFTSGYTANVIAHHGVLDEGVHFIQKPFSVENLATKLRAVLDRPLPTP